MCVVYVCKFRYACYAMFVCLYVLMRRMCCSLCTCARMRVCALCYFMYVLYACYVGYVWFAHYVRLHGLPLYLCYVCDNVCMLRCDMFCNVMYVCYVAYEWHVCMLCMCVFVSSIVCMLLMCSVNVCVMRVCMLRSLCKSVFSYAGYVFNVCMYVCVYAM